MFWTQKQTKNEEAAEVAIVNHCEKMTLTQLEFIKTCLKALPVLATMGGATAGWFLSSGLEHMDIDTAAFWKLWQDVGIGMALGFFGGVSLLCFGMSATHHVKIAYTAAERKKLGLPLTGDITPAIIRTFFDKNDVADNEKSVKKTTAKLKARAEAEALENSKILKHGTEELERQRKEKLGIIKPGTTSGVRKR